MVLNLSLLVNQHPYGKLRSCLHQLILLKRRHMLIYQLLPIQSRLHLSNEVLKHTPEAFWIVFLELRCECNIRADVDLSELREFFPE